jgi:uncharacterized protein
MMTPLLPSAEEKVAFLAGASAYGNYEGKVEIVETHMSWVFMTEARVYKLKKSQVRKWSDLRRQEGRYQNCVEEVRLNRRLGGNTYLGIERLSLTGEGSLMLGEGGVAVDWLVVMRRLPEAAFLEQQIKRGCVDYAAVKEAAAILSRFYLEQAPVELESEQYWNRIDTTVRNDLAALSHYELPGEQLQTVLECQLDFLARRPSLLERRALSGMILEAHGDLRPEHVCLNHPPVIIDCLEFSRDLRIQDRVDELAYLGMECERLGEFRVGEVVFDEYTGMTGDRPSVALVAFYKCMRACARAKLCVWHLNDVAPAQRDRWIEKARGYLSMAERYAERFWD